MTPRVLVGSLNPAVERLLVVDGNRLGHVHQLEWSTTRAGGKGVNVARVVGQLHDLGVDVAARLVGPLGGRMGELLGILQSAEGLEGRFVETAIDTRINEIVVDSRDPGGATVYNAPGPELSSSEAATIDSVVAEELESADFLVCAGSIPPGAGTDVYARWTSLASAVGVPVLVDARQDALEAASSAGPDIIKINRDELVEVGGDDAARRWLEAGAAAVVTTDGAGPTVAHLRDGHVWRATIDAVDVRSAVGSGDAFAAGLVAHLLSRPDEDWGEHLRWATACGASNASSLIASLDFDSPPAAFLERIHVSLE